MQTVLRLASEMWRLSADDQVRVDLASYALAPPQDAISNSEGQQLEQNSLADDKKNSMLHHRFGGKTHSRLATPDLLRKLPHD
jgi:hypothetical protein